MQLDLCCPVPTTQQTSLFILVGDGSDGLTGEVLLSLGDSVTVVSPSASQHPQEVSNSIHELANYLNNFSDVPAGKHSNNLFYLLNNISSSFGIFKSSNGNGLGSNYFLTRDQGIIRHCLSFALNSTINSPKRKENATTNFRSIAGVVLEMSSAGTVSRVSNLYDCIQVMSKWSAPSIQMEPKSTSDKEETEMCTKILLSALNLSDDEESKINDERHKYFSDMIVVGTSIRVVSASKGLKSPKGATSRMPKRERCSLRPNMDNAGDVCTPLTMTSSESARVSSERLAILSVASNDSSLRRYEASHQQQALTRSGTPRARVRRKKLPRDAFLDDFDYVPPSNGRGRSQNSAIKKPILQPDTRDRKSTRKVGVSNQSFGIPTLTAPKSDNKATLRKANSQKRSDIIAPRASTFGASKSFDPFSPETTLSSAPEETYNRQIISSNLDDISVSALTQNSHSILSKATAEFDDVFNIAASRDFTGSDNAGRSNNEGKWDGPVSVTKQSSGTHRPRILVNVALTEELTCSYKNSKISSCTVEGLVQCQIVESEAYVGFPFFLLLRDPSQHVRAIQENRSYANGMTHSMVDNRSDYTFTISVQEEASHIPVMRYKCGTELRPVPIRVQTRVRLQMSHCRVAIQISSNPANDEDLVDLAIIMGVPPEVNGETLTTSPAGGVWNARKRSVIWCVAELGRGEKFQLQAQFELAENYPLNEGDKPKFPVLVRCQCLNSQLSDIQFAATDITEMFPADVQMTLDRGFRLSHRERAT